MYFREDASVQFPHQREQLGRVLGPTINEGNEMAQSILKLNGEIVPRRTVRRLSKEEIASETGLQKIISFD